VSSAAARTRSTPYARRLAHERGIPLQQLRGSGPNGRIVAADIAAHVTMPPAPIEPPVAHSRAVTLGAFAATIDIRATRKLLADFTSSGHAVTLDDMVLRALAVAMSGMRTDAIHVEAGGWQVTVLAVASMSLGALHSARAAALGAAATPTEPADVSLRLLDASLRPILMPLLPGRSMRLALSAGADLAEALIVFDAAQVDEDRAGALLGQFRENLENPLRMLA